MKKKNSIKDKGVDQKLNYGLKLKLNGTITGHVDGGPLDGAEIFRIFTTEDGLIVANMGSESFTPNAKDLMEFAKFVKKVIHPIFGKNKVLINKEMKWLNKK